MAAELLAPFWGALVAWVIGLALIEGFARVAGRRKLSLDENQKYFIYWAITSVLLFTAVGILKPFPILSAFLVPGILKFQDIVLSLAAVSIAAYVVSKSSEGGAGAPGTSVTSRVSALRIWETHSDKDVSRSYVKLALMVWLPPIQIVHLLVAQPNSVFGTVGGIIAGGFFLISGPGSWTSAVQLVEICQKKGIRPTGLVRRALLVSLILTTLSAVGGTAFRADPTLVNGTILTFAAGFGLMTVAYLLFFEWGQLSHSKQQPAISLTFLLAFVAFIASINLTEPVSLLGLLLAAFFGITLAPRIFTAYGFTHRVLECEGCAKLDAGLNKFLADVESLVMSGAPQLAPHLFALKNDISKERAVDELRGIPICVRHSKEFAVKVSEDYIERDSYISKLKERFRSMRIQ